MLVKLSTTETDCQPQAAPCPVCARLASNLPPSLLELVDALEAKDGGRRELIAVAVFLGYMAGREGGA